ncbi:MAG: hypothetical protein Q9161_006382 [Pseudevernia consocians]
MACCYIAASMIAFIINTCDALNVDINLQYNESLDPSNKSKHADDDASSVEEHSGPTIISIGGMTCAACTGNVETALLTLEGVQRVMVSLPFQEARAVHDADVSKDAMVAAIEGAGYDAKIGQRAPTQRIETLHQSQELSLLIKSFSGSSQLSTLLFALGTGADLVGWGSYLETFLTPLGRQGTSSVNEAIVTGESMPKAKSTGDFLLAGTRNGPGQLECIVNQDQQGSFLSQLIRTVEDASASKATIQESVDKITKYFVSFVFLLSTAVSARLFLKLGPGTGFISALNLASQRMMAILAAACPCALGLATPCAIMAGIGVYVPMTLPQNADDV